MIKKIQLVMMANLSSFHEFYKFLDGKFLNINIATFKVINGRTK